MLKRLTCRADDATVACAERRQAVIRREFRHVWNHGWVWGQSASPMAVWLKCPWCDRLLPDLHELAAARIKGWMEDGWPDNSAIDHGEGE